MDEAPSMDGHSLVLIRCSIGTMKIAHYYRKTEPSHSLLPSVREELKVLGLEAESAKITEVETESCFNVLVVKDLAAGEQEKLEWLLAETFDRDALQLEISSLKADGSSFLFEFGPRLTFTSAFSSNATSICQACALDITRLELSRRYRFVIESPLSDEALATIKSMLYDRMTEEEYDEPLQSFDSGASTKPVKTIPIMTEGRAALEKINKEMGLGFDDFDLDYYTNLFKVGRTLWIYASLGVVDGCLTCIFLFHLSGRKNWDAILPTWNASTWDSPTRNIPAIGSLAERW
jgi:phosphoribosylformylglycinamidine synthase